MSSSNDPTPSRMLHELRRFVASLCVPIQRQRGKVTSPTFGHVQLPPYRLVNPCLMKEICDAIPAMDDRRHIQPLFVLPDVERRTLNTEMRKNLIRHPLSPEIITFSELLLALRANRREARSNRRAWNGTYDLKEWHERAIMPKRALVVIYLDRMVSADSALALIALVQWAFDVIIDTRCRIHILTMSTYGIRNIVPDLAKRRAPDLAIPELDLAPFGDLDPIANARVIQHQDIASQLHRAILSSNGRPVAIIFLGNEDLFHGIVQFCDWHKESLGERTVECPSDDIDAFRRWQEKEEEEEEDPPTIRLIRLDGNCPIIPIAFEGFDQVHIVLGHNYQEVAWNNQAGQLVDFHRVTARSERRDQIWWARQPNARVTCVYTGGSKLEAFLETGHHRHRLTEDSHMGGFMASVFDMSTWGIDPRMVFGRCVRATESRTASEILHRLTVQGIISQEEFVLPEPDATAFRKILPLVNYDYRLALFVAIDSGNSDTMVRMVKIQLAALISSGFQDVLWIQCENLKAALETDPRLLSQMIRACVGYGRCLARQGTMWLVLGLWKHFIHAESSGQNREFRALYDVVEVDQSRSPIAQDLVDTMCLYLRRVGITVPSGMNVAAEVGDINETQARQLQAHLLRSYLYQLIGGKLLEGQTKLSHKIIATDTRIGELGVPDLEEMHRKEGSEIIFGVCHSLSKRVGQSLVFAADWTYIPADIVAEWKNKNAPDTSLRDRLRSGIELATSNDDEFRGDTSNIEQGGIRRALEDATAQANETERSRDELQETVGQQRQTLDSQVGEIRRLTEKSQERKSHFSHRSEAQVQQAATLLRHLSIGTESEVWQGLARRTLQDVTWLSTQATWIPWTIAPSWSTNKALDVQVDDRSVHAAALDVLAILRSGSADAENLLSRLQVLQNGLINSPSVVSSMAEMLLESFVEGVQDRRLHLMHRLTMWQVALEMFPIAHVQATLGETLDRVDTRIVYIADVMRGWDSGDSTEFDSTICITYPMIALLGLHRNPPGVIAFSRTRRELCWVDNAQIEQSLDEMKLVPTTGTAIHLPLDNEERLAWALTHA
ncbi:hypothetical protein NCS52_01004600 [Fusarium sp. LHS14.1]|nr:hypothetical protein NCS52_01004600 [Fusarium sp. LHS14.1]